MRKRIENSNLVIFAIASFVSGVQAVGDELPDVVVTELSSVKQIRLAVEDTTSVLIDLRPTDAFNGWPMKFIEPPGKTNDQKAQAFDRGGHIPSAVSFPSVWIEQKSFAPGRSDEVWERSKTDAWKRFCQTHQLADKRVVLYGFDAIANLDGTSLADSAAWKVARVLAEFAGIEEVFYFDATDYFADPTQPLVSYRNYQLLLPPRVITSILEGNRPPGFDPTKPIKVLECSWGSPEKSYNKGHLPTAIHINSDAFEPPPTWALGSPAVLAQFAQRHGLHSDDCVIISGADPTAAHRLAWVLRYMGVRDVRVLNGGDRAWLRAGYALEKVPHEPIPNDDFGAKIPGRPGILDTTRDVITGLSMPDEFTLVDNRTWQEHIGETTGYSYHDIAGRIPGAVYGYAGTSKSDPMSHYRNQDDTMRPAMEIRALWKKQAIDAKRHLSFMCGGGWRAAEVFNYAHVIGIPDIAVYSDGWIGWSRDGKHPIVTGIPESNYAK